MRGAKSRSKIVPLPVAPKLPRAPRWLTIGARREWDRCAGDLSRRGLLFDGALASLATYCALTDQVERMGVVLARDGLLDEEGNIRQAHRVMMLAAAQARLLAAELGLSVVSRARSFQGRTVGLRGLGRAQRWLITGMRF
jgi:P27 family predicted phage terminase small subunit